MIKSYLKIALRNMVREKGYAVINLVGLAVGLACCVLIGLYVGDELSYEHGIEHSDRLYRLEQTVRSGDNVVRWETTSAKHGPALAEDFPEVEQAVRVFDRRYLFANGERKVDRVDLAYVDPAALSVFSFEVLAGDTTTMLWQPNTVVLTEPLARKLFGDGDPVGHTVRVDAGRDVTVAGVVRLPERTHLDFIQALSPYQDAWTNPDFAWLDNWGASATYTYVLLRPAAAAEAVTAQLPAFVVRHRGADSHSSLHLKPVREIRLRPETTGDTGTLPTVITFGAVAVLVLLIACINYVNLATARATRRLKEVGIRKAIGARRGQLVGQYLGESVLLALLGMLLALLLAELALPVVNGLSGKHLTLATLNAPTTLLTLLAVTIVMGVAAGAYPAFYLARFQPVRILKGHASPGGRSVLRRSLVVLQFAASIALIVGTLIIRAQLGYLTSSDLGFRGEQVLSISRQDASEAQVEAFEEGLGNLPQVNAVAAASGRLGHIGWQATIQPLATQADPVMMYFLPVNADYVETMDMTLVAGRDFSPDRPADDSTTLVLNETAVRSLGYASPQDILGKHYSINYIDDGEVIGVVKDFNFSSLRNQIGPIVLVSQSADLNQILVRIRPADVQGTLTQIGDLWHDVLPEWPFVYRFVDDDFNALYQADRRMGQVFGWFAALAVFIAGLGLLGLVSLSIQQRTKEIGIRKVFGATVPRLVALLTKEVVWMVALAFVLSTPAIYFLMTKWLQGFAYHVDVASRPGAFLLAGAGTLAVAVLTVAHQSIKAARNSPVKALRYE